MVAAMVTAEEYSELLLSIPAQIWGRLTLVVVLALGVLFVGHHFFSYLVLRARFCALGRA